MEEFLELRLCEFHYRPLLHTVTSSSSHFRVPLKTS